MLLSNEHHLGVGFWRFDGVFSLFFAGPGGLRGFCFVVVIGAGVLGKVRVFSLYFFNQTSM